MNRVELCRKLAAIDSSASHGTSDIAAFVADIARQWDMQCEIQYEDYNGVSNANIILRNSQTPAEQELLLIARLDTLDPGDYAYWVRTGANPFNISVDGEDIYGLGLSDAKADFACKLLALKETTNSNYKKISPVVVGTFGHSSGAGAIRLIRKKKINAVAALVGAPTQLYLATKGPGYAKVEISIPFTDAEIRYNEKHNSIEASISQNKIFTRGADKRIGDEKSENPILRMFEYLKNLPQGIAIISVDGGASPDVDPDSAYLEIDIIDGFNDGVLNKLVSIGDALKALATEFKTLRDEDCDPDYSTITIGTIRTFPEEIKISGICRLVPAKGRNVYESWLERLRQDCIKIGANFRILDYKPPFESKSEGAFFEALINVSLDMSLRKKIMAARNCTEANIFQRLGIESIVFGPGEMSQRAHASEEKVKASDLAIAETFYKKVIERYCI